MNLKLRARLWVSVCFLLAATAASAQDAPAAAAAPPPPAHLFVVEGTASVDRDGEREAAVTGLPIVAGDRIRTDAGRVEMLFTDGSALQLDERTTADLLAADLIRLIEGRIALLVAGSRDPSRAIRYQVDAPAASVQALLPGQYRITCLNGEVELAVFSGEATLATDRGAVTVSAGEVAVAVDGQAPSAPAYFNSARWDSFDRWSAMRRDARLGSASGAYLPQNLSAYSGVFDRYGTWRDEPEVGYVWYPAVAVDWRPYYYGFWRPYRDWGSVWIGSDPWGWPTHHYGRWGFSISFGWYWIPERAWGPAWVYWGTAPGYVSWCALGRHGGPVFGQWGLRGGVLRGHVDPWRGWTVIPRHNFGHAIPVTRLAVDARRLPSGVRGAFIAHRTAPPPSVAVPRSWAGGGYSAAPGSTGRGDGGGGTRFDRSAHGSAETGAARRFGRGDGTGLSAPVGSVGLSSSAPGARRRREVPGSVSGTVLSRPTPSEAVGISRRPDAHEGFGSGRDAFAPGAGSGAHRTPGEVVGAQPTPSQAVGMRGSRPGPSGPPATNPRRSGEPPRTYEPSASSPRRYESAPRTYEPSASSPRRYESAPQQYIPSGPSSPRRYESAPRTYERQGPSRGYGSAPRAYEPPSRRDEPARGGRGGGSAREAAPRYNSGRSAPRASAPQGSASRRSPRDR